MATPKVVYIYYLISRVAMEELTVHNALDMIRYDAARIESNAPPGYYLLVTNSPRCPCVERWKSFGITIEPWQINKDRYFLIDAAREHNRKAGHGSEL